MFQAKLLIQIDNRVHAVESPEDRAFALGLLMSTEGALSPQNPVAASLQTMPGLLSTPISDAPAMPNAATVRVPSTLKACTEEQTAVQDALPGIDDDLLLYGKRKPRGGSIHDTSSGVCSARDRPCGVLAPCGILPLYIQCTSILNGIIRNNQLNQLRCCKYQSF